MQRGDIVVAYTAEATPSCQPTRLSAAYLRMSDYELREAAFRGGVRETLAEIGADFVRMIACPFDLDC